MSLWEKIKQKFQIRKEEQKQIPTMDEIHKENEILNKQELDVIEKTLGDIPEKKEVSVMAAKKAAKKPAKKAAKKAAKKPAKKAAKKAAKKPAKKAAKKAAKKPAKKAAKKKK